MQRRVAQASAVPVGTSRCFNVDGKRILVLAGEQGWRAFSGLCPHRGAPLEDGAVVQGVIVCPWHRSLFDASSGDCLSGPARLPLRSFPVKIERDQILVDLGNE